MDVDTGAVDESASVFDPSCMLQGAAYDAALGRLLVAPALVDGGAIVDEFAF